MNRHRPVAIESHSFPKPVIRRLRDAVLAFAAGIAAADAGNPTPLQIEDLYRTDTVADFVVLPDMNSAVYSRQWADPKSRTTRHALWRVTGSAGHREPLDADEPDGRSPVLSPDGKWIAFLSTRALPGGTPAVAPVPRYSDPAADVWLMPASGGSAIPPGGLGKPYGRVISDRFYGRFAFSPDGKRLVFIGVETEMVIYPDEGHPIQQLPHREDVLRRVLDWFDRHDRSPAK